MDNTTNPSKVSRRTLALMAAAGATAVVAGTIGIGAASADGAEQAAVAEIQLIQPANVNFSIRDFLVQYVPGADLLLGTPDPVFDWGDCPACGMG